MTAPHNGIASENEIKNLERSLSGRFSGIKFSTVMKCQELTMTLPCVSWNFITLPCQQRVGLVRWLQCVTKTASNQLYNFEQIIKPSKWNTDNQLVKVVFVSVCSERQKLISRRILTTNHCLSSMTSGCCCRSKLPMLMFTSSFGCLHCATQWCR